MTDEEVKLLDYFAACALNGLCSGQVFVKLAESKDDKYKDYLGIVAGLSYEQAGKMMEARKKYVSGNK